MNSRRLKLFTFSADEEMAREAQSDCATVGGGSGHVAEGKVSGLEGLGGVPAATNQAVTDASAICATTTRAIFRPTPD